MSVISNSTSNYLKCIFNLLSSIKRGNLGQSPKKLFKLVENLGLDNRHTFVISIKQDHDSS